MICVCNCLAEAVKTYDSRLVVGDPDTRFQMGNFTVEQLKRMGFVGLYRRLTE